MVGFALLALFLIHVPLSVYSFAGGNPASGVCFAVAGACYFILMRRAIEEGF